MSSISIDQLFKINMDKFITCCFTGHRPQKLLFRFQEDSEACAALKEKLRAAAVHAIDQGYKIFICGGSIGIDYYAAEIILDLKETYPYIRLHLALPCRDHERKWRTDQKQAFRALADKADKVIYVNETGYFDGCMQLRNQYMVDHANLLIAAFNGSAGGTKQTITYAEKNYIDITLIPLEKVEE